MRDAILLSVATGTRPRGRNAHVARELQVCHLLVCWTWSSADVEAAALGSGSGGRACAAQCLLLRRRIVLHFMDQ